MITVEDLLAKMRAGVKEIHEIKMRELTIPVRVLSIDEMNLIRRDTLKKAMAEQGDQTDVDVFKQRSVLVLASTTGKDKIPFLSEKLLKMLTVDEINYLYNEYITVVESVNPSVETISNEQFRALVDALKKNIMSSKDCSLPQLKAICTAYADLIQRQETTSSHKAN